MPLSLTQRKSPTRYGNILAILVFLTKQVACALRVWGNVCMYLEKIDEVGGRKKKGTRIFLLHHYLGGVVVVDDNNNMMMVARRVGCI